MGPYLTQTIYVFFFLTDFFLIGKFGGGSIPLSLVRIHIFLLFIKILLVFFLKPIRIDRFSHEGYIINKMNFDSVYETRA